MVEKVICCGICMCQMIAILSGVSILYLAKIVISPSYNELGMDFKTTPLMCTTLLAQDLARKGTKPGNKEECKWKTCSEWCLSKDSAVCMQISVMVRNNGSKVNFRDCVDIVDEGCSALNVSKTQKFNCKEGECKDIEGMFACTKDLDKNDCREIAPAYDCPTNDIDPKPIWCEDKCEKPLSGVYSCKEGKCQRLKQVTKYWIDCERKCTKLEMREKNVVIFSRERLVATYCSSMESPDNRSSSNIESVSNSQEWRDKKQAIFMFCTYVKIEKGNKTYDMYTEDCFNGTMGSTKNISALKNYMDLLALHQNLGNQSDWILVPEIELKFMNDSQLRINNEGCVNTLSKECTEFFATRAHDGSDGITQDRYPCFYSDKTTEYVIGKYNPEATLTLLLVLCILPSCLFIVACACLFLCSKSVGVDDEGHLRVTLLQGGGAGGNASEL